MPTGRTTTDNSLTCKFLTTSWFSHEDGEVLQGLSPARHDPRHLQEFSQ